MSPPPCLCSLSVWMAVKCGICGVLNAEVSFDYCIVTTSGCVVCMRCLSSVCVELKNFYLFVFCLEVFCLFCVCQCAGTGGGGGRILISFRFVYEMFYINSQD